MKLQPKQASGRNPEPQFINIQKLDELAELKEKIRQLELQKEKLQQEIDDQVENYFVSIGTKKHYRPANFVGIDKNISASCQLRLRSKNSALNFDEVTLLKKCGITFQTIEDKSTTFIYNPKYINNAPIMKKVHNALKDVEGLPSDLVIEQIGEERKVVTPDSINQVFQQKGLSRKIRLQLLRTVGSFITKFA